MALSYGQIEALWIKYGGNPRAAPMAAAIAMAESSGNPGAVGHNTNGSVDRGLFQINSVHGGQSTTNLADNVRAAIAISNNGQSWHPWTTYTSGAYQQFLKGGVRPSGLGNINFGGGNIPSAGFGDINALAKLGQQQVAANPKAGVLLNFLNNSSSNLWNVGKGSAGSPGVDSGQGMLRNLVMAQSRLQAVSGATVLKAHPALADATSQVLRGGGIAGGFLPHGAMYVQGRKDQGRDGQTNPGGPLIAPGAGYIVRVGSDPNGFGPRYVIAHFTTGRYAGRTMYLGHALATMTHGSFRPGQVLARTGTHPVGNASVPGWFEIGFADHGSPGPFGQSVPF